MHDLRFAKAIYMPRPSGDGAPAKTPYDPVKALEGMFNGSVTRIAYALKDPANFGAPTKTVLTECAKRFHDALDDCEIQLLDAKWYLEDQLAQNRAKREAKAREMGTAAKRKHEEIKDVSEGQTQEESPLKKSKIEAPDSTPVTVSKPESQPEETTQQTQPQAQSQIPPQVASEPAIDKQEDKAPAQDTKKETSAPQSKQDEPQPIPDDFAKPTPQVSPSGTNDDFNFESMFGEPTGDQIDLKDDNGDLGFDLGMTDTFAAASNDNAISTNENQDPSTLDSLLPGLDTFANQLNDTSTTNNNINNNNANNSDTIPRAPTDATNTNAAPTAVDFSNDFGLPEVGSANIFDAFLNDDSLNDSGNYQDIGGGNGDLLDENFLNMDLDMTDDFFS